MAKYQTPPNPSKTSGDRSKSNEPERERNVGHSKGEEHSRNEKGQQSTGSGGKRR